MRRRALVVLIAAVLAISSTAANPQSEATASAMTERGTVEVSGKEVPYVIRRLPISSFPQLPEPIAAELEKLGCMIPQTFEAHRPENVVEASLERTGSADWAVLCSTHAMVKLIVFFGSAPTSPAVLVTDRETARLETHDASGVMGFAWGIDPASPQQVRQAQSGMRHREQLLDHDALADSFLEKATVYHFFSRNVWSVLQATD
jgi:hypothetical protein